MNLCCQDNYEEKCPILDTHDKYVESWYFLIKMVDNYHNPKLFRWYLNAYIQSIRNVTFILQSEKSKFNNFDKWYKNHQDMMRGSSLLRRFVDGRNIIVKQRMLSLNSTASAGIYAYEKLKIAINEIVLNPFTKSTELLEKAKSFFIPLMLDKDHSTIGEQVGITRTWISSDIGEEEIVYLCYKAWCLIGNVVEDAHNILGYDFLRPTVEINRLESKRILLETDLNKSLSTMWGWK